MPKCGECRHYQKTQLTGYSLEPYIGKGYTLDEILEKVRNDDPIPIYDCPYASDWCEAEIEANTLCKNKYEPRKRLCVMSGGNTANGA